MKKIKKTTLILKPNDIDSYTHFLPELIRNLYNVHCAINMYSSEKERMNLISPNYSAKINFIEKENLSKCSDLIITLGGDGTLIGICRDLQDGQTPIFSINLGKLGFLTEFSKESYLHELSNTINGNFSTIKLRPSSVKVIKNNEEIFTSFFLNDVVIGKNNISRLINLAVLADNEPIFDIFGDGIIISTPHGSTAYSLSAGGPIIHPDVPALVLTPICPHTLNSRPLVTPDNKTIIISAPNNDHDMILTVDGQLTYPIEADSQIVIHQSCSYFFHLVKNPNKSYFNNLKEKLIHGKRLW